MSEHPTDRATRQAIETLLWSEVDDAGEPLDERYGAEDLSAAARREVREDVKGFLSLVIVAASKDARTIIFRNLEQAGHDFILTRNGHGTGFWDRGYGDAGDELSSLAKTYGEQHLYDAGDMVHVA